MPFLWLLVGLGVVAAASKGGGGVTGGFPGVQGKRGKLPLDVAPGNPILNPNIELATGKGHVTLPTLEELAAVTARARFSGPLDGDDNMGGGYKDPVTSGPLSARGQAMIADWAKGIVIDNGEYVEDRVEARKELFRALLSAIDVGLARVSTDNPTKLLLEGKDGFQSGEIIGWTLAYMASPALGDLRSRVYRMVNATEQLIAHPTAKQYLEGRMFDLSWMEAGAGISQATGNQNVRASSVALRFGMVGYVTWQIARQAGLVALMHDWKTYIRTRMRGSVDVTIANANQEQLINLAISVGAYYFETAAQKTANWPAGLPSKVDTLESIKQLAASVFSAGVAAFSGNYAGLVNAALTAGGHEPLPAKVGAIMQSAGETLESWAKG